MKGISYWFFLAGVVAALIGMSWGIQMSISHDHLLSPAHGHLNLLGWVSMSIYALFYHLVPAAGESRLARVHFAVALVGLVTLVPGIAMAISGRGEGLAAAGTLVVMASMILFAVIVLRWGRNARPV
jgi:hypothetical protein